MLFSAWSCTFRPSIVMFRALPGSPMTDEYRGALVVLTPGSITTKSIVLRVGSGALETCVVFSVVATVADCVCISSVAPVTVMVSATCPTSRATGLMLFPTPWMTMTSGRTTVLKPISDTVTV